MPDMRGPSILSVESKEALSSQTGGTQLSPHVGFVHAKLGRLDRSGPRYRRVRWINSRDHYLRSTYCHHLARGGDHDDVGVA